MRVLFIAFTLIAFYTQSSIAQVKNFNVSGENVSRLEIQTIDRDVITLDRVTDSKKNHGGDIQLEKRDKFGKVIWTQTYGGSGYEYIGSFTKVKDGGFIIVGTTSSFGEGNNNVYLVRTDADGKEMWSKTYGGFFNEYGKYVREEADGSLSIKATKQFCKGENVGNDCYDKAWNFRVDREGNLVGEQISELTTKKS